MGEAVLRRGVPCAEVLIMETSPLERFVFALLILITIGLFLQPLILRYNRIKLGRGDLPTDRIGERIRRWITEVLFQGTVIAGRPAPGLGHAVVFWSFIAFLPETGDTFVQLLGFKPGIFGECPFHSYYQHFVAFMAVAAIIGIVSLFIRRFFIKPKALGDHISWTSGLVAIFITALMATYILGVYVIPEERNKINPESGRPIAVTNDVDPTGDYSVDVVETAYYETDPNPAFKANAWVHSLIILAFIVLIPRSKHIHLFLALINTFFKDFELIPIKPLDLNMDDDDEDEEEMYLGAEKFTDLGKKTILNAFTCVECGRCFDNCPARITGKQLDPKQFMLNLREIYLNEPEKEIAEDERFTDVIWQCTTCGACTFQCPTGIDQPLPIIEMRRGYVANSVFPDAMRPLFDNLESTGNPWNYQPGDAVEFISDQEIPEFTEGKKVLWWMGCMARYDENYRTTAVAFNKLMKAAGVEYGVLVEETCTGDAARRAGNEFLFQMMAENNIENINTAKPEMIVTTCPHCMRTLMEYKDLGMNPEIEVIHHTEYLKGLMETGKLKLTGKLSGSVTYHDPCYLSRYQDDSGYRVPRELIEKSGKSISEPERTKRKSFCCGAGGGMLFTEELEGTRINHERVEELMKLEADEVCIACPFCQMMLKDGYGDKGVGDAPVRDIAEILADCL